MKPIQFFFRHKPIEDKELKLYQRNSKSICPIGYDFCIFFRALELNKDFQKWLLDMRKKANIPEEGYNWKENPILSGFSDVKMIDRKFFYFFKEDDLKYLLNKLPVKYKFTLDSIDWSDIVTSNALIIPYNFDENLKLLPMVKDNLRENRGFNISFKKRFSKEDLHRLIDECWEFIKICSPREEESEFPNFRLKERDVFLLTLREVRKLTFKQISDELDKFFPLGKKEIYSEDSAKTAYHRAKIKSEMAFNSNNINSIPEKDFKEFNK